jgi:hypothetical protein
MFSASGSSPGNTVTQRSVPGSTDRSPLLTSPATAHKGSINNNNNIGKPELVGANFASLDDAAAYSKATRIGLVVVGVLLGVLIVYSIIMGVWVWNIDLPPSINQDSLTNEYESRAVEFGILFDNSGDYTLCSGGHIGSSGQVIEKEEDYFND